MDYAVRRKCKLWNGVSQGSVLLSSPFNLYVSDMPKGDCSQYAYADDSALGISDVSFQALEGAF